MGFGKETKTQPGWVTDDYSCREPLSQLQQLQQLQETQH